MFSRPRPGPDSLRHLQDRATPRRAPRRPPHQPHGQPAHLPTHRAVHLLEAGVEVNVIRGWLGHADLTTTNRYAEINTRDQDEAALRARAPGYFGGIPPARRSGDPTSPCSTGWRRSDRYVPELTPVEAPVTISAIGHITRRAQNTDNEKTVTIGHIAGVPVRNRAAVTFGRYYGISVLTCEPADPASKGGVENAVKLAKADIVPTETNLLPQYATFADVEAACAAFVTEINARVHRTTGRRPVRCSPRNAPPCTRCPTCPTPPRWE